MGAGRRGEQDLVGKDELREQSYKRRENWGTAFPVHLVLAENSKEYEISKFEPDLPGGWLWRRYIC